MSKYRNLIMSKFRDLIESVLLNEISTIKVHPAYNIDSTILTYKNPSKSNIEALINNLPINADGMLRGIGLDNNIYVWNSYNSNHLDILLYLLDYSEKLDGDDGTLDNFFKELEKTHDYFPFYIKDNQLIFQESSDIKIAANNQHLLNIFSIDDINNAKIDIF